MTREGTREAAKLGIAMSKGAALAWAVTSLIQNAELRLTDPKAIIASEEIQQLFRLSTMVAKARLDLGQGKPYSGEERNWNRLQSDSEADLISTVQVLHALKDYFDWRLSLLGST
ncbi:hypothetical protein ACLOJK_029323 [Asimina triloba]